jgi:hypothetical protein
MKPRRSIFWFACIIVVLIAAALWLGKRNPAATPPLSSQSNVAPPTSTAASPPINTQTPVQSSAPTPKSTQARTVGANLAQSLPAAKAERAVGLLSTYNDVPIDFYGRVEDQFTNGIPGVAVNFSVRVYNGVESTVKRGQVMTDGSGLFTISGYNGESLSLVPEKSGYVLATTDTLFKYSHLEDHPYESDRSNPTVIKMWKRQGAEPLVGINKTYRLPYTGEPIFFDLVTGQTLPSGGDLKVVVTRSPGVITQRDHGDWSIQLVPVSGGIIETDYGASQVAFDAPESGYQDNFLAQMSHDSQAWFDNIQKAFFLESRGGQVYSKFSLNFGINDDPNGTMWFEFKGVANANGSRNWEASAAQ